MDNIEEHLKRLDINNNKDQDSGIAEQLLREQLDNCHNLFNKCKHAYMNNKEKIDSILETYKEHLPLLFINDLDVNGNLFAKIMNNPEFDLICVECSYFIVQSYNYNEKTLINRYFLSNCAISKGSLCYN